MPEIQVRQGTIRYRDEGSGPVIVLVHGLLVNGAVWDSAVTALGHDVRVVVPELPLGSHRVPMNAGADLSPLGLARLIADFLEGLDLEDVTLVGNDTGGALCQLTVVHHPERIGRLVLTNCDAFEHFPPAAFAPVVKILGRVPGAVAALALMGRSRRMRGATMKLAPLTVSPVADELLEQWVAPLRDRRVRRDLVRVLRGISPAIPIAAGERLHEFGGPSLLVWGMRDRFFPFSDAERIAAALPGARVEPVKNARTFVQLDAPDRLAALVAEFATAPDRAHA